MPVVPDKHVTTTEVRGWRGLHLLHAAGSLSSRKVELLLAVKGLSFNSRPVAMMSDSARGARGQWYLGINPRGLVPTLVHNGVVLIESNDILVYLAQQFPDNGPVLPITPAAASTDEDNLKQTSMLLRSEDDLHLSIRTIKFSNMGPMAARIGTRILALMSHEEANLGVSDVAAAGGQGRDEQRSFYAALAENGGVTAMAYAESCRTVMVQLAVVDTLYKEGAYLVGTKLGTADIAYWVTTERLLQEGLPIERELPNLFRAHIRIAALLNH